MKKIISMVLSIAIIMTMMIPVNALEERASDTFISAMEGVFKGNIMVFSRDGKEITGQFVYDNQKDYIEGNVDKIYSFFKEQNNYMRGKMFEEYSRTRGYLSVTRKVYFYDFLYINENSQRNAEFAGYLCMPATYNENNGVVGDAYAPYFDILKRPGKIFNYKINYRISTTSYDVTYRINYYTASCTDYWDSVGSIDKLNFIPTYWNSNYTFTPSSL